MPRHRRLNLKKFAKSVEHPVIEKYVFGRVPAELRPYGTIVDGEYVEKLLERLREKNREDLAKEILEEITKINDVGHKTMNVLIQATDLFGIQRSGKERKANLALRLFNDYPEAFQYAYDKYCIYASSSTIREYPVEGHTVTFTDEKVEKFKNLVSQFYGKLEKGYDADIRFYQDDPEFILVVDRGSYYQTQAIWEDGKIKTITYRPANEDTLIYNKDTKVLSIKAPYDKDRKNYRAAFYQAIIGDMKPEPDPEALYTLKPLQEGTFDYGGDETIGGVKLLRVILRFSKRASIVLTSPDLTKSLKREYSNYSLAAGEIAHAKFKFQVILEDKEQEVGIEITPPNVTDLYKKVYSSIIGDYLKKQGVKLK